MVTDREVRRLMELLGKGMSLASAAAKADMDEKTARKYRSLGKLPHEVRVEHSWRTREDSFDDFGLGWKRNWESIQGWRPRRSLKICSAGIRVDSGMGNFGPCSVGSRYGVHCRGPPGGILPSGAQTRGVVPVGFYFDELL
jgi:hypothetical protein